MNKILLLISLTLTLVSVLSAQVATSEEDDSKRGEIYSLYGKGECETARALERRSLFSEATLASFIVSHGTCLELQKQPELAEVEFSRALTARSVSPDSAIAALYGLLRTAKKEVALQAINEYIGQNTVTLGRAYTVRSAFHLKYGDLESAIDDSATANWVLRKAFLSSTAGIFSAIKNRLGNDVKALALYDRILLKYQKIADDLIVEREQLGLSRSTYHQISPLMMRINEIGLTMRAAALASADVSTANRRPDEALKYMDRVVHIEPRHIGYRIRSEFHRKLEETRAAEADMISMHYWTAKDFDWHILAARGTVDSVTKRPVPESLASKLMIRGTAYWKGGDRAAATRDFNEAIGLDSAFKEKVERLIAALDQQPQK